MDARHRIGIMTATVGITTAVGITVAALGGAAQEEPTPITLGASSDDGQPPPDTDLGRAAQECIEADRNDANDFTFYDEGQSMLVDDQPDEGCILQTLGLPEWVGQLSFVGVLKFGDWSVMTDLSESGALLIMSDEVAPDN